MTGYQSKKKVAQDKLNKAIEPHTITFHNNINLDWVMRITADRRIEVNEGVEVTEAAQKVLDALQNLLKPAQRTWVGLTDEEIIDVLHPLVMADMSDEATDYEIARAIEAKLKEKNNG